MASNHQDVIADLLQLAKKLETLAEDISRILTTHDRDSVQPGAPKRQLAASAQPAANKRQKKSNSNHDDDSSSPQKEENAAPAPTNHPPSVSVLATKLESIIPSDCASTCFTPISQYEIESTAGRGVLFQISAAQARFQHDPPKILAGLLALAKNEHYIHILTKYSQQPIGYDTENSVKSSLVTELESIMPTFVVEDEDYPIITLGRGVDDDSPGLGITSRRFRYIHPQLALQTFAQFYHLERHWPGCMKSFYSNPADLEAITKCSALSHHFFGGYAATAQYAPNSHQSFLYPKLTNCLESGLHLVGAPGSGKTELLSMPVLLAAVHGIPMTIASGYDQAFLLLTIDPAAKRIKATPHRCPVDTKRYTHEFFSQLESHLPKQSKHLLIIDPVEQTDSAQVMNSFNWFYSHLHQEFPNVLSLSAHSTPTIPLNNQYKFSAKGGLYIQTFSYFQFTNMELSHASLQTLFTAILKYPGTSSRRLQNVSNEKAIAQYFELARFFTVPTLRGYHMFFIMSRTQLLNMMHLQFPTEPTGGHLNIDTLGLNAMNYRLIPNSTYVTVNTDTSSQRRTTSSFICHTIPSFYSITRRREIDEKNALVDLVRDVKSSWKPLDANADQNTVLHRRVIERRAMNTAADYLDDIELQHKTVTTRVMKTQLQELHDIGQQSANATGSFIRFSSRFPLFDFMVVNSPANIDFISLKTGADATSAGLYAEGARSFASYYQQGLRKNAGYQNVTVTANWCVLSSAAPKDDPNRHIRAYTLPEEVFGLSDSALLDYYKQLVEEADDDEDDEDEDQDEDDEDDEDEDDEDEDEDDEDDEDDDDEDDDDDDDEDEDDDEEDEDDE